MELPSLPTDNLYKFIALSGIALVIVSMLPFFHRYKLQVEIIRLEGDIDVLERQTQWTVADVNELKKEVATLLDKTYKLKDRVDKLKETQASDKDSVVNTGETSSGIGKGLLTETKDLTKKRLEIEERLLEIKEINRKHKIKVANIKAKNKEHKYLKRMINMESKVGCAGLVSGFFLAIIGFTLWYKRLQVPQDRMLKTDAEGKNIRRCSDESHK
ncbi:hypothetical protein KA005_43520 [bacterium]|nr:hypothetical protein [bacterium]